MAKKNPGRTPGRTPGGDPGLTAVSSPVDQMLLVALERGGETMETGRYLVTMKEEGIEEGIQSLGESGMRVADARDFSEQEMKLEELGDADAVVFPEIGVALIGGEPFRSRGLSVHAEITNDSPIESIDPELFVFSDNDYETFAKRARGIDQESPGQYLRGFADAAQMIAAGFPDHELREFEEEDVLVLGATIGLRLCRVPPSPRSGVGIRVAVLDTGMDLGHPDFLGRPFVTRSFVGQPVQDLHSHGTHCIGTACGPLAPAGTTPRYGIAYRAPIFVGKVLSNSGGSVGGSVLNGMNWAIANRCPVISMSLGGRGGVQPSYTAAGAAALTRGLLVIAAAGNNHEPTGYPANSPTIMSVAALTNALTPASFSNFGKIDISGPGVDVFSSVPRPTRYGRKSGTSMATPHVSGVAALWAESSASLRGMALWRKLQASARKLPFHPSRVGAGLVQAP